MLKFKEYLKLSESMPSIEDVFYRLDADGNAHIFHAKTEEAVTRLDADVYDVNTNELVSQETTEGVVISLDDAEKLGLGTDNQIVEDAKANKTFFNKFNKMERNLDTPVGILRVTEYNLEPYMSPNETEIELESKDGGVKITLDKQKQQVKGVEFWGDLKNEKVILRDWDTFLQTVFKKALGVKTLL